jgi:hypothetical protein
LLKGSIVISIIVILDLSISIFILLLFHNINTNETNNKVVGFSGSLFLFYLFLFSFSIVWIVIIFKYKYENASKHFIGNPKTTLQVHNYFIKSFPYFLFLFLILVSLYFFYKDIIFNELYNGLFQGFIIVLQIQLILSSIFIALTLNKDYYFYKSKAHIEIAKKSKTEEEKIEFIFSGIETYDKYLQRRFKIKFKNFYKIKEYILENNNFIDNIYKSFETHLGFIKIIQISFKDEVTFEHLTYGWWKDMDKNAIIIAIITSIISLIQILWN